MKKITYLIVGTGLLWACSKSEIEIQKNTDTSWEIDKKIQENDIRGIIGYDPRFDYVYFSETTLEMPMITLGEVPLVGKNTKTITLQKTGKSVQEDLQITLSYDASIFEKLKANYSGYELGDASLVNIPQMTQILSKGANSLDFQVITSNDAKSKKKLLVPFSVKTNKELVIGAKGKDYFVVEIVPKEAIVVVSPDMVEKNFFLKNGKLSTNNTRIELTFGSDEKLPSGLKIGLVRDIASLPPGKMIAPDGVEGSISPVDFGTSTQDISFDLDLSKIPAQPVEYTLPMKWLIYDNTGKSYDLGNNIILVNIKVKQEAILEENTNNSIGSHDAPRGNKIPHTEITFGYETDENTGNPDAMVDGKYDQTSYFKSRSDQFLHFSFDKERVIRSIRLKAKNSHTIGSCTIYGYHDIEDKYKTQGKATFTEMGEYYTITFKNPIPVKSLAIGEFFSARDRSGAWFEIYEAEFYEE